MNTVPFKMMIGLILDGLLGDKKIPILSPLLTRWERTHFCALILVGLADGPCKYSYICINVILPIFYHYYSACDLLGEVGMMGALYG